MSVPTLMRRCRVRRLRLLTVAVSVLFGLGLFQVSFAVTRDDVKAAIRQAGTADRAFRKARRDVGKLRKRLERLTADETKAKADLAAARTELAAAQKKGKQGKGGFQLFAGDPGKQADKAAARLKELTADKQAAAAALARAEAQLRIAQGHADTTRGRAEALKKQLDAARLAEREKKEAKTAAAKRLSGAAHARDNAANSAREATAKLEETRARVALLKAEKVKAKAAVTAKTKLASHAADQAAREAAVREMRAAENHAAAISRELDQRTYAESRLVKRVEVAQLAVTEAETALRAARQDYAPYQAEEDAARAAVEKARQEKLAAGQRKKAEKARKKAEAAAAKEKARDEKLAADKREKAERARKKAEAAAAKEKARQEKLAAKQREKAAREKGKQVAKADSHGGLWPFRRRQKTPAKAGSAAKVDERQVADVKLKEKAAKEKARREEAAARRQAAAERDAARQKKLEARRAARQAKVAAHEKEEAAEEKVFADKVAATRAEQEKRRQQVDNGVTYEGNWPPEEPARAANARAEAPKGKKFDICAVVVTGDRDAVTGLEKWRDYENDALYAPMSEADIEAFRQRILKDLQDDGYVFATVSVYKPSLQLGFLKLRAHVGEKGEVVVKGNRWYTAEQVLDAASWETGAKFNYRNLYSDMFDLNVRPDVRANVKLKPRMDEFGRRVIDVEMDVEDRFPIHGSLALSNTGSKETSDWRLRTTLQHLNLTKHNDILTLEWLTDPYLTNQVNALSGSYYLPLPGNRGLTLYGGWSESDINDVAPELDVYGQGYYFGGQYSWVRKETDDFVLDANVGWLFQYTESGNDLAGLAFDKRDVATSMPSLTIGYAAKKFDRFGGRNFWSNQILGNLAGKLGASNNDKFTQQAANADGDFIIDRFHFARLQKLFAGPEEPGKWTAFFRSDIQFADDALIPSVQKGIGGADSVRGYREREVIGDSGFTASLELRTPLIDNFIPGLKRSEEYLQANPDDWKMHRLQFITFVDFGMVAQKEPLPGEAKTENFSSAGAGLRLGLTKYSQIKFDYGLPFEQTDESHSHGRGHLSLQLQF